MSKITVWKKDNREVHINDSNEVVAYIGQLEELDKVNKKNGWKNTGEPKTSDTDHVEQVVVDELSKAKYESMIKAGLSTEDASNLSGYTEE